MLKSTTFRSTLAAVACAISLSVHGMAAVSKNIEIPAGDLRPALLQLSKTFGIELFYQPSQLDHFRTAGVRGNYTPEVAVRLLLRGTPLELRTDPSGAMMVIDPKAPRAAAVSAQSEQTSPPSGTGVNSEPRSGLRLAQAPPGTAASTAAIDLSSPSAMSGGRNQGEGLEEIVVTAQKRSERLIDVPLAITALSGETLMSRGVLGFEDYRSSVPGLATTPFAPGLNQFTIRGVTTGTSQLSSTVATYFDEAPTNSNTSTAFGNKLTPDPDMIDIAQIEVLRGPQGNLYGANALGGVIRFILVQPELNGLHARGEVGGLSVEHGSVGYVSRGAISGALVDGVLGVRLSGFYTKEPGFIDNTQTGRDNINQSTNAGGRIAFLWKPMEGFSASLSSLYQDRQNDAFPYETYNRITGVLSDGRYNVALPTHDESVGTEYQLHALTLNADFDFATLTSATSYGRQLSTIVYDISAQLNNATQTQRKTTLIDQRKLSEEVRLASRNKGFFEYVAGVFYTLEKVPARSALSIGTLNAPASPQVIRIDIPLDSRYEEVSVFANTVLHLGSRFDLQLGGRWSHNTNEFVETPIGAAFGALSGKTVSGDSSQNEPTFAISPEFKLSSEANLYARIAKGFRPGGANPVIPPQFGTTPLAFGPDSLINYELGAKMTAFDRRLTASTALYRIDWKDIHTTGLAGPFSYNFDGGRARSRGIEAEGRWSSGALTVDGNVSFNDAETRDRIPQVGAQAGDPLPYSPRWSGALNADYAFQLGPQTTATIGAGFRYTGKRQAFFSLPVGLLPGKLELAGYALFDLRAGLRRGPYTLTAFVQNVTDKYAVASVDTSTSNSITGVGARYGIIRPRTIGLTLGVEF